MTDTPGRILAIDYGSKRVGLAVSDPLQIIAQGAGTLANDDHLIELLIERVRDQQIVKVIVGMPFAPDGGLGAKGAEIQAFLVRLKSLLPVDIAVWDESYTTVEAGNVLRAGGMKRKDRRARVHVDEMAARLLLQEYLESNDHR